MRADFFRESMLEMLDASWHRLRTVWPWVYEGGQGGHIRLCKKKFCQLPPRRSLMQKDIICEVQQAMMINDGNGVHVCWPSSQTP